MPEGNEIGMATLPSGADIALVMYGDGVGSRGDGPADVSFDDILRVDEMFKSVKEFASTAASTLKTLSPDELEVEFSVAATVSSGRLVALVVDGDAEATIKVRLMWSSETAKD